MSIILVNKYWCYLEKSQVKFNSNGEYERLLEEESDLLLRNPIIRSLKNLQAPLQ